ncbi:cytochrome P450 [Mycena pura]|uniref:Cytochrome P450 n=1 Tax=Mycena pura TaxID=153505 RepID=A0AAD6UZ32_9AGAR|nr:cytochrome P450 [Mycena pura]
MTTVLPPGIRFLGRKLLAPSLFFLLINRAATHPIYGPGLSASAAFLATILATVTLVVGKAMFTSITHVRAAKALGARLVPRAQGTMPGSIDLLRKMLTAYATGYIGEALSTLVDSLGPVMDIRVLWSNKIFTVAPEHIQMILATDFTNYVKGEKFRAGMDSVLGNGVFNSDGEMWSFHRSMTRPYFSRDRFQHFDIFDRHTDRVIALIRGRMAEGHAVDFQDLISRLTMDSATEFLFGSCVDSLMCTPPYPHNVSTALPSVHDSPHARAANAFTGAYSRAMVQIAFRQRIGPLWPLFEMFVDKTAKPMEVVGQYIDPIIQTALEKNAAGNGKAEKCDDEECLLDAMLKSTSDAKLLKDEILNILIGITINVQIAHIDKRFSAGRDTTMSVLTTVMYFLSTHKEVTSRLREEIMTFVGPCGRPTYDNIKQMKYLRAVINETMRLYPPVPFNIRQSVNATVWPSPDPNEKPLYIPAGVQIVYSVMIMQRRPDLWGPDAHLFDPSRFLDERHKRYVSHPFQFLPFNAGPRICLGQQFAYNEMAFVITRLLQNFASISLDVDACPPSGRVPPEWSGQPGRKGIDQFVPKEHLTMYTLGGLWVKMEDANSDV